ncbi:MAG: helix-turn-helix transcriptional regulator [Acutalibacteraceae bacterium]
MSKEMGDTLKKLRNDAHLTQQQIADALNIHRTTYAYYELGKTEPNIETLCTLAKILNVSYDQLLPIVNKSSVASGSLEGRKAQKEKIYELSSDEQRLVLLFRNLSEEEKQKLLSDTEKK